MSGTAEFLLLLLVVVPRYVPEGVCAPQERKSGLCAEYSHLMLTFVFRTQRSGPDRTAARADLF